MPDTIHLGLPLIEAAQAQKHVTHNEALLRLDTLVQLAVTSRALSAPPAAPAEGDRYIVKAVGTGAFAGKDNQLAQFSDGGWVFYPPKIGWLAFIADEGVLVAWDGSAWVAAVSSSGDISELQNLLRLGVGTEADATNPFSAKLNNALWVARTEGEGGDGNLRYKLSKESAAKTLSILYQDNFSGRAEIGLCGDDDFHFKVSPDGSSWIDALVLDRATGAAKLNAGLCLAGDISPPQIAADQNDYDPSGLATASVLRLASDASRNLTGLAGGGDGRIVAIVNVGANNIVLKDASTASAAANRFAFGADVTLGAKQCAVLWYDAADARWKLLAAPQAGGGRGGGEAPADLELLVGQLAFGLADALNAAQFLGAAGNRFADSFDTLAYVDAAGAVNLDTGTAGVLKPTASSSDALGAQTLNSNITGWSGYTLRMRIAASSIAVSGSQVRLTLTPPTSGASLVVSAMYIGHKAATGDPYDFAAGKAQVKVGGAGSFTLSAGGANMVSDWITFSLDEAKDVIVALDITSGDTRANTAMSSDFTLYYKASAAEAATDNVSGYTTVNNALHVVSRIEVQSGVNNLVVRSAALPATAAPLSMKAVARINPVDGIALNTEYKISVSRDNGTTWTYAALNDRFTVNALHMLESDPIDVSGQPSGTQIKWRIETLNNKLVETHDIYLYWS